MNTHELLIISKYLNFKDIEQLIKINPDLKYYFHSTFDLINIPIDYVLSFHSIKIIIDTILSTFPNIEEIILNTTSDYSNIIYNNFINILINYINFRNTLKNDNIKIFINFKQILDFHIHDQDDYLNFKLYVYFISKLCGKSNVYIRYKINESNNNEQLKNVISSDNNLMVKDLLMIDELRTKYKINFINDFYSEFIDDMSNALQYYFLYTYTHKLYNFNELRTTYDQLNNPYMQILYKLNEYGYSYSMIYTPYMKLYLSIMKLKRIVKNLVSNGKKEELKNMIIRPDCIDEDEKVDTIIEYFDGKIDDTLLRIIGEYELKYIEFHGISISFKCCYCFE